MYRDGTFRTELQQMISGGLHVPDVNMNMMSGWKDLQGMCMAAC